MPKKGGRLKPHCYQTQSGLCVIGTLKAWADFYDTSARGVWEGSGVPSTDPDEVLKAGKDAAQIQQGADEVQQEAAQIEPCDHCPWRRK